MHLGTKKIAFLGLLLALTVTCISLSSVIETSTLFFLAVGAFLVGAAVKETGVFFGFAFYLASISLSLILAPNKLYCLTFGLMGGYVWMMELIHHVLKSHSMKQLATLQVQKRVATDYKKLFFMLKWILFNLMYLPVVFWFPNLLFPTELSAGYTILIVLSGQVIFALFDLAYQSFFNKYWNRLRKL